MVKHYRWSLTEVKNLSVRERTFWIEKMNAYIESENAKRQQIPESMRHG